MNQSLLNQSLSLLFLLSLLFFFEKAGSSLEWCTDEDRAKIEEVGFEWDEFGDGFKWDDVVAGLTHYKTLYGELPDDDFQVKNRRRKKKLKET